MTLGVNRRAFLAASGATAALGFAGRSCAAEAPPPVEAFAQSPGVDKIAISPDGSRIAIMTQTGDSKKLIWFNIADLKQTSIDYGVGKARGLLWSDNSHVLSVRSTTAHVPGFVGWKQEYYIGYNVEVTTGDSNFLFANDPGFYNIIAGDLHRIRSGDGYEVTASSPYVLGDGKLFLYAFTPKGRHGRPVTSGTVNTERWVVRPDGYVVARSDYDEHKKVWTLLFNTAAPQPGATYGAGDFKIVYSVAAELDYPELVGLGREDTKVIVYMSQGEAGGDYHEIGADGILGEPLDQGRTDDPSDSNADHGALFHPTTWRLAGFSRQEDWTAYDYFDPKMAKLIEAIPTYLDFDARTRPAGYAEDPRKMVVYRESANDAGSYHFIDFSTGASIPLMQNYPDVPMTWITEKKPVSYKAADGLTIHGYLTLPPMREAANLPLIVLPHGGPESRDDIGFDWQTQCFASRGYAVLQPNFRGSSGYGQAFIDAGHGEWGRKMQSDLSDGVRWLCAQGISDPKRVAIVGASYGGYAALAGATLDTGIYRCAVSIAGPSNMKRMIDFESVNSGYNRKSSGVLYWKQFMGDPARYDEISPDQQAARADCPIMLIHGNDDTVVPIDQSQHMQRALKAAGKTVEFVTYKGQDHWESYESSRIAMMKAALGFLDKYNPAYSPDEGGMT